jgi:hypothetical protein
MLINQFKENSMRFCFKQANTLCQLLALSLSFLLLVTLPALASNVYVAVDRYDYDIAEGDIDLSLNPIGAVIGGAVDLSDTTFIQYEFGKWGDDETIESREGPVSDFDSNLIYIGLSTQWRAWDLMVSYADVSDDLEVRFGNRLEFLDLSTVSSKSIRLLASHNTQIEQWTRYYSIGLQFDDSEYDSFSGGGTPLVSQANDGSYATFKFGGDHFFPINQRSGWLIGASLTWHQELSSNESIDAFGDNNGFPPPRNSGGNGTGAPGGNGGGRVNRTFGDSYGLIALYGTYQINDSWSLDWNSSIGVAGDENSNSHSLTLGYEF